CRTGRARDVVASLGMAARAEWQETITSPTAKVRGPRCDAATTSVKKETLPGRSTMLPVAMSSLATQMPGNVCDPTSLVRSLGLAPRKSALQVRNLGLGQFADRRVDAGDWLPLSAREMPCGRPGGPGRATRFGKCRQHAACQRRYDAPTHGRAEGQKVQSRARCHGGPRRIRFDRRPRCLLLEVAVRTPPKRARLSCGVTKRQAFMAAA